MPRSDGTQGNGQSVALGGAEGFATVSRGRFAPNGRQIGGSELVRIVVTGASGFVGSHVVDHLVDRGDEVHAIGRTERTAAKVIGHRVDLLAERDRVRAILTDIRPTHLIHTAWYATPGTYQTDPVNYQWVTATIDLAEAFVAAGGQRFTGAGTCVEYDLRFGFMNEALTPVAPSTPYAVAKDAARRVVESICISSGASFAWGRIFAPYGPREHPSRLTASVARSLLAGGTAEVSAGLQVRDFLHVRDVAAGLVCLARTDHRGVVNIASGQAVAVRDFVTTLATACDATDRVVFAARAVHAWEPPLLVGDNTLLRSTGWKPEFDLDSGIADAVAWWRNHG